jgi:hypothetical protein
MYAAHLYILRALAPTGDDRRRSPIAEERDSESEPALVARVPRGARSARTSLGVLSPAKLAGDAPGRSI